jgi:hypothetical protein
MTFELYFMELYSKILLELQISWDNQHIHDPSDYKTNMDIFINTHISLISWATTLVIEDFFGITRFCTMAFHIAISTKLNIVQLISIAFDITRHFVYSNY